MRPAFLASVTSVAEARLAVDGGADIVDCKDPNAGALGALPVATVAAIRAALPRAVTVSATIGDLPAQPDRISAAVREMAASGCEIVKVGLFPGGDPAATIAALGRLKLGRVRLAGLLLADRDPDWSLVAAMGQAGFAGVMLDTAGKSGGGLTAHLTDTQLGAFVADARDNRLFAGLAGSLRLSDIAPLVRLKPHVLGFRGALCAGALRTARLDPVRVSAVRSELDRQPSQSGPTAAHPPTQERAR